MKLKVTEFEGTYGSGIGVSEIVELKQIDGEYFIFEENGEIYNPNHPYESLEGALHDFGKYYTFVEM